MGITTVAPLNVNVDTRVTARANGIDDVNGNKLPPNMIRCTPEKSCHGVCGSMLNPSWRTKANAKLLTVHNRSSESFCI